VTTKHSAQKNVAQQAWKFVDRRLSAKVLHDASNAPGAPSRKAQHGLPPNLNIASA
jgi:hypothetical protein